MYVLIYLLKGLALGILSRLPALSAGTSGWMLGMYDQGIYHTGCFYRSPKNSLLFLLFAGLGAVLGGWLLVGFVNTLSAQYPLPVGYLLFGGAAGCLPALLRRSKIKRVSAAAVLFPLLGIGLVVLLRFVPTGWLQLTLSGWAAYPVIFLTGLLAGALILLPGLPVMVSLGALGLYGVLESAAVSQNLLTILCLLLGVFLGLFGGAKLLNHCMYRHAAGTHLLFFGMVLGEMGLHFPGVPSGAGWLLCLLTFLLGLLSVLLLHTRGKSGKTKERK